MESFILAQDVGVYSCRAYLFSLDGELRRSATTAYAPNISDQGWVNQDPSLWWDAFCKNCHVVLHGLNKEDILAVVLCGQSMGCLPVDGKGQPLMDSIIWEDKRSAPQAEWLREHMGQQRIYEITGVRLSHMFALSKQLWLKEVHPEIYEKTRCFLQCKDYINFRLTGQMRTDETDAGFTQLYDLMKGEWSGEILDIAGLDEKKQPEVVPAGTVLGTVTREAAEQTGLSPRTKVVQGMNDGRAVVLGSGAVEPGQGCVYLGATSWVSQITEDPTRSPGGVLSKTCYYRPGLYTNGGTMLAGRLSVDWFIREFISGPEGGWRSADSLYRFLDSQVAASPVGSKGMLFLPYLSGERAPWWNNSAKGGFVGLSAHHNKYDFCRSILEGVAFNLGLIKNEIEEMGPFRTMSMVGAANSRQWQQILSDVFEMDVTSSCVTGSVGGVGVALAAGVGLGVYEDYSYVSLFHRDIHVTHPIPENVEIYQELVPTFEDVYHALSEINRHLNSIRL